jgi:adenylate kinase
MNLILLGPPGAGKGTQAARLRDELGMTYVATGDLLRRHRAAGTALGREAARYMADGRLVPDELVVGMIINRIAAEPGSAFLLDGFPRTINQAEKLAQAFNSRGLELTAVLLIDTPTDVIESRICGRRQCRCGRVYHVEHDPPREPGLCDDDGKRLIQRDDDQAEIVRRRLAVYDENTAPLVEYYRRRGLLHCVDGTATQSDVAEAIRTTLDALTTAERIRA